MRPAGVPATPRSSEDEFTAAGLVPRRSRYPATGFPQVLLAVAHGAAPRSRAWPPAPPDAPVTLRYVDPTTGAPPLPTMGAEAQWLQRPGERTRADRTTASRVYHVIEGHGQSRVGETLLTWAPGDTFVAPRGTSPTTPISGDGRACLFQFNDEPVLRARSRFCRKRVAERLTAR